jgi:proline dehydrogenase
MRALWRSTLARLATSPRLKAYAQSRRIGVALARRYTGGTSVGSATELALGLHRQDGIQVSLFHLGEYVRSAAEVAAQVAAKHAAIEALGRAGLNVHVSVDPTQIGLLQGAPAFEANLRALATSVATAARSGSGRPALMLDMEDASVTDATLAGHAALRETGLPAAITLQAYRHRTGADLARLVETGSMVRLVKGAFPAGPALALQRPAEIDAAYLRHARTLLSGPARAAGVRPVFATHDHRLHAAIAAMAADAGWAARDYEFEMLLGARDEVARALARAGHAVRLYVPFGTDWWPYAMRRIGENPASLAIILRGVAGHG